MAMNMVKFNVGGYKFETSNGTVAKYETMLKNLVKYSDGNVQEPVVKFSNTFIDDEGYIVIDRDGRNFHYILNFLRDGSVALPDFSTAVYEILTEANFYSFEELKTACMKQLVELNERDCERFCRCVYTPEELKIVIASKQPVVVMSYNLEESCVSKVFSVFGQSVAFFKKMRPKYPRFCFVTDMSEKTGNFVKFEFYHDGKMIKSVNPITSCPRIKDPSIRLSSTHPFTFDDKFKSNLLDAIIFLLGAVALSLDTSDVAYVSKN